MNNDNIYATPKANLDQPLKKGSPVKAIIFGFLADIMGTLIFSFIFSMIFAIYLAAQGMNEEMIENYFLNIEPTSTVGIISTFIGLMFSVLGGYICARIAKHNEFVYATMLGIIVILFGLVMSAGIYSIIENIIMGAITFCAIMGGAFIYTKQKA